MLKRLVMAACWLITTLGQAQDFNVRHFTVEDGLPSGHVIDIYQDCRGYLWVATDAGISRYDGSRFTNYSLKDGMPYSYANDIQELDSHHLAISTGYGVSVFDGESFQNFTIEWDSMVIQPRKILARNKQQIFVTSRFGLFLLNTRDSSYRHFDEKDGLLSANCHAIMQDSKGRVLVTSTGGISIFNGTTFQAFLNEKKDAVVFSMIEDQDGYIWYGVLHRILKRIHLDSLQSEPQRIAIPDGTGSFVAAFLSERQGKIYVGGDRSILVYEDGQLIRSSQKFLDIPSDVINFVYADNEGNIWAASQYGLWRLSSGFTVSITDATVAQSIYSVLPITSDSVYFTDGFFIYLKTADTVRQVFTDRPTNRSELNDIFVDRKGYWYFGSTLTGLVMRTPEGEYRDMPFPPSIFQRCFQFDSMNNGHVIMGSNNRIYELWDGKMTDLELPGLQGNNILSIKGSPKGGFWFGTNMGLGLYRNGEKRDYSNLIHQHETVVEELMIHHDLILVGTKGRGIFILQDKGDTAVLISKINTDNGLPSDYIVALHPDNSGNIWVASKMGISKVIKPLTGERYVRNYSSQDGIPNAFWEHSSFRTDEKGQLWIGSSLGLLGIDPEGEFTNDKPPQLLIIDLTTGDPGKKADAAKNIFIRHREEPIPYAENDLSFTFNGVQLRGADNLIYSYKLAGFSAEWRKVTGNNVLSFNNLPPGKYTLYMQAFDPARQLESAIVSYPFEISRPFYMSGWFYFLLGLLSIFLIYSLFKWRVRVNYQKQSEKVEINRQLSESRYLAFQARMNPHFIFNSLNSIQYFITKNDKKSSLTYLSKFARLLRQVLDNSKALKIPLSEELEILKSYVEMESMRFSEHFSYQFEIDEDLEPDNTDIPGMILQPFVENAIIHGLLHKKSGEGRLILRFRKKGAFISVTIEDNGIGRKRSTSINAHRKANHKSHGMEIARNRLALLAEDQELDELIEIEDLPEDAGTIIHIQLPII